MSDCLLLALRAGLDFVFHMFFLVKYCKALEEGSFRSRSADFLWMLVFGAHCPGSDLTVGPRLELARGRYLQR